MREIFVGSDAVASRRLSEYELRRWYRPVYRDVIARNAHGCGPKAKR
jgi:hypothetical protein